MPAIDQNGQPKDIDLLVGPASQIIALISGVEFEGVMCAESVAAIVDRTDALAKRTVPCRPARLRTWSISATTTRIGAPPA